MTEDATNSDDQSRRRDQPLGDLGRLIDERVTHLTNTRQTSATIAGLARLRANLGRSPGQDPEIWDLTIEGVSADTRSDDPTSKEWAAHAALTLFAVHQQSVDAPMHHRGIGFGRSVATLARKRPHAGDGISPIRRRFNAVVTSSSVEELAHHVRGLVGQMKGERIGFDYAAFADDLYQFQRPGGADVVRRRWGRQFHRLGTDTTDASQHEQASTSAETDTDHPKETR